MAIEVGALSLAIETNTADVTNELKKLDRELKRVAANQAALNDQSKAASKLETQLKREMLAAQKELNRLAKTTPTGFADIKARIDAQARLNQLTVDYAEAKRLAAAAGTSASENRQYRDALKAELSETKQVVKEIEADRKASEARVRAYQSGLGKAHVEAIRAEVRAETEERRRQSAMQRDIDKRTGVDRQRMDRVVYAQRQTLYNELFVAETASTRKAERERVRASRQADREIAASRRASERAAFAESERMARQSAARRRLLQGDSPRGGGIGLATFGLTGTFAATMAAGGLFRAANDAQLLQQRLAQVTESGAEASAMFRQLFESSQRLRTPVADVTELFVKLRQSNDALGYSYDETLQVTEAFSAALRISGASGQTAASALLQFGQAMAKGRLDGDEFRTVAENASEVLRSLERAFGVSRGEILKWREEGKLTSKMIADVLIRDKQALIDKASQLAPTMRQAATQFRNAIVAMVTDSKTLEEAFAGVALSISKLSTSITENKEELGLLMKVLGYGAKAVALATGLGLIAKNLGTIGTTMGAIAGYASRYPKLFGGGVIGGSLLLGQVVDAAAEARALDRQNKLIRDAVRQNASYAVILERVRKAQSELTLAALSYNATVEKGDQRAIKAAKNRVTAAFDALAAERRVLDTVDEQRRLLTKGAKDIVITAEAATAGKEPKDTTDQFIASALAVAKAGQLQAKEIDALQKLYAKEQKIVAENNQSLERRAQALARLTSIQEVYAELINVDVQYEDRLAKLREDNSARVDMLVSAYDSLDVVLKRYAAELAKDELYSLNERLHAENLSLEDRVALLERIRRIQQFMAENDTEGMGTGGKPTPDAPTGARERLTALERYYQQVERQIVRTLLDAPSDLVTSYFEALGQSVVDGGASVGEKMRQAFASIFGGIGSNLVRSGFARLSKEILARYGDLLRDMAISTTVFGKFLTKIQAALSNPLIAGPALVAVGAAMVAYSARMGAIGRGAGAELGGGIGGLGVGGSSDPIIYRLADRPYQSAMMPQNATPREAAVVVNATVIGPNDPRAQRDIAALIDNAARRGLTQSSRGRVP